MSEKAAPKPAAKGGKPAGKKASPKKASPKKASPKKEGSPPKKEGSPPKKPGTKKAAAKPGGKESGGEKAGKPAGKAAKPGAKGGGSPKGKKDGEQSPKAKPKPKPKGKKPAPEPVEGAEGLPDSSAPPVPSSEPSTGAPAQPPSTQQPQQDAGQPRSQVAKYLRQQVELTKAEAQREITVDPRTSLPLINVPQHHYANFKDLADKEYIIHNFEDVDWNAGPPGIPMPSVLIVTDQVAMLMDTNASSITWCNEVSKIKRVDVSDSTSELALVGPDEKFDLVLNFKGDSQRSAHEARANTVTALSLIYRRITDGGKLPVGKVPTINPQHYRTASTNLKPEDLPHFRTKAHLKHGIESLLKQREEALEWMEANQRELETEHREIMRKKEEEIHNAARLLQEVKRREEEQAQELARLHHLNALRSGEGTQEDLEQLDPKDRRIFELESELSFQRAAIERKIAENDIDRMAGSFTNLDVENEVKQERTRPRGGSLHMQGLVEVLQNQLMMKEKDLDDMQEQLLEVHKMQEEIRHKDALIRTLQTQTSAATPTSSRYHPQPDLAATTPQSLQGPPHSTQLSSYRFPNTPSGRSEVSFPYKPALDTHHPHQHRRQSDYAPSPPPAPTPFVPERFQSRLPTNPAELQVDPNTGLELVRVPPLMKGLQNLNDMVVYFVDRLDAVFVGGNKKNSILVITHMFIYDCDPACRLRQSIPILSVNEILVNNHLCVGLKLDVPGHPEERRAQATADLMIEAVSREQQQQIVKIIQRVQQAKGRGIAKVTDLRNEPITDQMLVLMNKSSTWAPHKGRLCPKEQLLREARQREREAFDRRQAQLSREHQMQTQEHQHYVLQQQQQEAHRQAAAHGDQLIADAYTQQALEALRHDLRMEFQAKKDQEYQRLQHELNALRKESDRKTALKKEMEEQWKKHRCQPDLQTPNIPPRVTEGMYWIPTEPVVIQCELEVLKVQFWDNILITSHANGFLNVWDIDTGDLIRTLKEHTARVETFQYDGVELVSGSYDCTLRRWNVTDGSCMNVVQAHRGQVTCLQFDRNILVSGATDATIQVWQMDVELRNLRTLRGHRSGVTCLKFERNILVSAEWGWLFVWNLQNGQVTKALRDEQGGITCIEYVYDMFLVTGGHVGTLTLWDTTTGEYETLEGHTDDITHIQMEGAYVVTSSSDCTIRMWNLDEFKSLGIFNNSYPHECKSFQFIANRFVAAEKRTVKIWTK